MPAWNRSVVFGNVLCFWQEVSVGKLKSASQLRFIHCSSPTDRAVMQKLYGTSYGEQNKNKILDLATLGDGYQMKDGGYFSLSNGKVTRTDYTMNNFNYLTSRVHNTDGTVSEMYSSGSYMLSMSKTHGEFNLGEVYGSVKSYARTSSKSTWGASRIMSGALSTAGILAADDVTGIGVLDDPAIPFVLAAGIIASGIAYVHDNGLDSQSDPTLLGFQTVLVSLSGYYDSFAKSKRGKQSARQEEVKHGGRSENVKGRGAKGDKHTKRRPGDLGDKKRQKPGWIQQ